MDTYRMSKETMHIALIALAIYLIARIAEAVLNVWGKNPLRWAENKAAALATQAQNGAGSGLPNTAGSTNMGTA